MARETSTTARTAASEEQGNTDTPQYVEWTGEPLTGKSALPFEERVLTRKDLKDAYGVDLPEGMGRLVWNAANRHRIPVSDLTPAVVEVLTQQEANFRLTDKRS